MPELTTTLYRGVACEGRTCDERLEGEPMPYFDGKIHYAKLAEAQGWQCWVGRGRRWYCPECRPGEGHRMRLLYGRPRERTSDRH